MSETNPAVLLVLHDVAPETWADYQPFVEAVDALGDIPMTWLVVPDFHKRNPLATDIRFQRVLEHRLARGDELALHGYHHSDDGPPPKTPREYFMRRIFTWEGEFYALDYDHALARLQAGVELFERLDWPLHGFVAPAWLMSLGTREALRALPFSYTSDSQHLFQLPDFSKIEAPGIVWSAGSAWRRGVSKLVSDRLEFKFQTAQTIRLGLHPVDMRHTFSRNYWLQLLQRLMDSGRTPMTKASWLATQRPVLRSAA
ncbi:MULTISPECIES: polysaccharide deacetylase family protein [unclassified Pseudomonas]|uniref:polysaccharide deacetylase family protein n=1 Tax=unclassified Pseudomonas TaxID=196821 RepID=UPI002ACB168C|nr:MULTISPECIES: polysaccharide deacetylase family protein [unclassified Pseudomonas]MEB0039024.1 polysaccharide deacetylase family protein [Pseudomonas sp. MH10]MEB0091132.1 polysaccharide deacetylase family protein [Pseudomonas sp. CCI4.2]MEB0120028.1 polysaccharide deacetylase family protein [Pseudomonas sp. CCI1.2]WPX56028.1 polysaccharide deacetylase family protein [Pseudomonas sp. CCI4.2]WPX63469.1 polysaccharide deacetylase family protein [Pseudomonas sp. MH10]